MKEREGGAQGYPREWRDHRQRVKGERRAYRNILKIGLENTFSIYTFGTKELKMKSISTFSILFVVFVLAGCGGGGSSRMAMVPMAPMDIAPEDIAPEVMEPEVMDPKVREPEEPMAPGFVQPPPSSRPVENVEARRVADELPGGLLHVGGPFEGYMLAGGVLRDDTVTSTDDPVKHADGFINITGWQGSRHTRSIDVEEEGIGDHFDDTFVSYTNIESSTDTDYIDFGYWTRLVRIDPDNPVFTIDAFVFGSSIPDGNDLALVEGSASYSGPATGLYAKKSGSLYRTFGQFKANTTLQVNYGVEDTGPDAKGVLVTISGNVTDFRDSNGNVIDSTWTVDLQEAQHSPLDVNSGFFDPGTTARGGKWKYLYFGVLDTNDSTVQPGAVGGLFNETFPNGKVTGAFAATKN